eukprot:282149_1
MLNNRLALLLAFLGALVLGVSGRQDAGCRPLGTYLWPDVSATVSEYCRHDSNNDTSWFGRFFGISEVDHKKICVMKCRNDQIVLGREQYDKFDLKCVNGSYKLRTPGGGFIWKPLNHTQELYTIRCGFVSVKTPVIDHPVATKTNECPPLSEYLKSYVTVTVSDICHNGTGELEMVPDARICGLKCRKSDGLVVLGTNMYKSVDLRCVKGSYQVKLPGKKGYKKLNRLQKLDTIRCENDDVSRWFFKDFWGTSHGNLN